MNSPIELLKRIYGYDSFRRGQGEVIFNILKSRDALSIMPTGSGKSICYQIPAIILEGITLVISPLISLMKDQVDTINSMGITAEYINSTQSLEEIKKIISRAINGDVKLLYIAPERLDKKYFVDLIKKLNISQIAIDEAHCVSMWGHDFRESYRNIAPFIDELKKRPVITAFTATATNEVRLDIIKLLGLNYPYIYKDSFDRDNLEITIHKEEDKLEFVKAFVREQEESAGIIYCATRKEVDGLFAYLKDVGISASKYHGGLKDQEKNYFQEEFLNENSNLMIATNAFGMGIDKSNVRYIIHFTLPKNIENYYQEIGRSGRDGEKAECHLLYNRSDIRTLEYLIYTTVKDNRKEIELGKLGKIIEFCETKACYRSFILSYFGEENVKGFCSNCSNCLNNEELRDFTVEAQMILSTVYRTREQYGISVLIDILRGFKGPKIIQNHLDELTTYGLMKEYNSKFIRDLIKTLIDIGYVDLKAGTYSMLKLNEKSIKVLKSKEKVICSLSEAVEERLLNKELFDKLKQWRKETAFKEKIKPYIIFSDSTLIELSNKEPKTKEELMAIRGMGEKKLIKYGKELMDILKIQ